MKKILFSVVAWAALAATLVSCSDFLDEDPKSDAAPELIFNSRSGIEAALRGCYRMFTINNLKTEGGINVYGITPAAQRYIFLMTEAPGDDCWIRNTNNAPRVTLDTYEYDGDNENIAAMYFSHYVGIKDCNVVLNGIKDTSVDDPEFLADVEAEAKAVRAYMYFNLVRLFGDCALVTEDVDVVNENLTRQPMGLVYKQIVADLGVAAARLPERHGEGAGRMSSAAAHALLADVYLTMAGRVYEDVKGYFDGMSRRDMYKEAAGHASLVMGMSEYDLFGDYRQLFTVEGNNSCESILEAVSETNQYATEACPDVQNSYDFGVDPQTGEQAYFGMFYQRIPGTTTYRYLTKTLGRYTLSEPLKALFDQYPKDKRMRTLIKSFNNGFGNRNMEVYSCGKYADSTIFNRDLTDAKYSRAHFKMIRLAEVMLTYAEAMNEYNNGPDADAKDYLRRIRERAGIMDAEIPADYEGFKEAVEVERRKELYFEGYRWFDLVRRNQLTTMVPKAKSGVNYRIVPTVLEKHYLFPIPNAAYQFNSQLGPNNPGW